MHHSINCLRTIIFWERSVRAVVNVTPPLCRSALHYTALHRSAMPCTALHRTVPLCAALPRSAPLSAPLSAAFSAQISALLSAPLSASLSAPLSAPSLPATNAHIVVCYSALNQTSCQIYIIVTPTTPLVEMRKIIEPFGIVDTCARFGGSNHSRCNRQFCSNAKFWGSETLCWSGDRPAGDRQAFWVSFNTHNMNLNR